MTLHEAMKVVLLEQPDNVATIELIADEINGRKLFGRRDRQPLPAYQVMMRAKLSKGKYHDLFEWIASGSVKLKV